MSKLAQAVAQAVKEIRRTPVSQRRTKVATDQLNDDSAGVAAEPKRDDRDANETPAVAPAVSAVAEGGAIAEDVTDTLLADERPTATAVTTTKGRSMAKKTAKKKTAKKAKAVRAKRATNGSGNKLRLARGGVSAAEHNATGIAFVFTNGTTYNLRAEDGAVRDAMVSWLRSRLGADRT